MASFELAAEKTALRKQIRQAQNVGHPEVNKYRGWLMLQHLRSLPAWKNARTVLCFASTGTEPNTEDLLQAVLESDRNLCLPRIGEKIGQMDAVKVAGLFALAPNKYGILQPPPSLPATPPSQIDLVVVPCLAMTAQGVRLGHGGGYYDRFLRKLGCPTVAFCPSAQILEYIPHDDKDVSIQYVITENGILTG